MAEAPRFRVREIELYERPVVLRHAVPLRRGHAHASARRPSCARASSCADGRSGLGRRGRTDGAQVVRQEPGADQRGQLRPAARRAAAWRATPTCATPAPATRLRPFRPPPRQRTCAAAAARGLQPAAGQLRPGAGRPRGARCPVPRARRFLLRRDASQPAGHRRRAAASSPASTSTRFLAGLQPAATHPRAAHGRHWSMRSPRPT